MIETRFKDTEVGRIPEDWEIVELRNYLILLTDYDANGSFADMADNVKTYDGYGYAWYVRATDLEQNTDISKVKYTDLESYKFLKKSSLYGGEVLVAKRGDIGKVYLFQMKTAHATLAPNLYLLKLNDRINPKYLYSFLKYGRGNKLLKGINASTSLGAIYKEDVKSLPIISPSLSEQTRIATALSNIDTLISELGKLIEKKRAIKQGAMQQLLTGKKRLKGFSEPWVETTLGEHVLFLRTGLNPRVHFKLNTPDADCFYITVRELQGFDIITGEQTDKINHSAVERIDERSRLKIGDVLFSGTGTIGQTALVKEKPNNWGIKEGIYAITPNSKTLDSSFLIYYLHTTYVISLFSSMSSGSTINSIPMGKLLELPLRLPSLSEQSAIASVLSSMDEEISSLEAKREKYASIKQGMMQQLLTGKIRLVETALKTNATSANVQ